MRNRAFVRRLLGLIAGGAVIGALVVGAPSVLGLGTAPCSTVNVTTNPTQAGSPGYPATLTASSTGCTSPEYQFYLQAPGGVWTAQGAYSATATFNWDTTGLHDGFWGIGVWARAASRTVAYDVYWLGSFDLYVTPCEWAGIGTGSSSPQRPGASILLQASGGDVTGSCTFEPKFLAKPPGGAWTTLRAYGPGGNYTWNTTGLKPGVWELGVWIRRVGAKVSYDAYAYTSFTLLQPIRCAGASLTADVPSPQAAGATVTFTGGALAGGCSTSEYAFWRQTPDGTWSAVRAYSTDPSFVWNTAAFANGRYQIQVRVRAAGSSATYETYKTITYYIGS